MARPRCDAQVAVYITGQVYHAQCKKRASYVSPSGTRFACGTRGHKPPGVLYLPWKEVRGA